MEKRATHQGGLYVYAVVHPEGVTLPPITGIHDARVELISAGRVGAAVSRAENCRIRPERKHIAAHQQVLRLLTELTTPLPVSFGVIAEHERAVRQFLRRNEAALLADLVRLSGQVEMGLSMRWDVANIFEHFVDGHAELREFRDRIFANRREPSHSEKIELGRTFEVLLGETREKHADSLQDVLMQSCSDVKRNPCRSEREVVNMACLVPRGAVEKFEAAIFEAASMFDSSYSFDFNGPWAPHNFVESKVDF